METEDYEEEYMRDAAFLEAERIMRMEAEWLEAEYYEEQLPCKIEILIETNKKEPITKN